MFRTLHRPAHLVFKMVLRPGSRRLIANHHLPLEVLKSTQINPMPKFSQRHGYNPIEQAFQRERIDEDLRITLWNVLSVVMWNKWEYPSEDLYGQESWTVESYRINDLTWRAWVQFFKNDLDSLRRFRTRQPRAGAYDFFKKYFLEGEWFAVYDFLEFLLQDQDTLLDEKAITHLNQALKNANAVYRIVGKEISEITDANEIKAIEEGMNHPEDPVRTHIRLALEMLSDRKSPDYRNSIKESISAVEAACRQVTGMEKATLGEALKKVPNLHQAMAKGFLALYGFTSDESGIRHALNEESTLSYADAKFMLVACAAFGSYLRASADAV